MDRKIILKWFLVIGGYVEIILGIAFMFFPILLKDSGIPMGVPIFTQLAGGAILCYGILLANSAKDVEKHLLIIKTNCLLRFIVQPPAVYTMFVYPPFIPLLIGTAIYDVGWAVIVLYLLKKQGFL